MDYTYDGQIRRYVTQFMRIFIGFKYRTGGTTIEDRHVPVTYGDITRQVASILRDNSENKLPTVPKISCYITGLELDSSRLSDPTFVSKLHIRQRKYTGTGNTVEYQNTQGGGYTVERLMPSPYLLSMKADIWTSNTDQKLQLIEQILVMFNPSLEIQTTDNFIDWTSLSVVNIKNINFTSRTIPQGTESDIDVCSLEFNMPIWISAPAKVKKLGVVQTIIANVFTESGDLVNLDNLIMQQAQGSILSNTTAACGFDTFLIKVADGSQNEYELSGLNSKVDWNATIALLGNPTPLTQVYFIQPSGYRIVGTIVISLVDPNIITVTIDPDSIPSNSLIPSLINGITARGTIDSIIDPYKYNPVEVYGSQAQFPLGLRFLILDSINTSKNVGQTYGETPYNDLYDGPDAWKNLDGTDPVVIADSIIEWNGTEWVTCWDPVNGAISTVIQNVRTGIKYRWDGYQWLKAFEGQYSSGYWGIII